MVKKSKECDRIKRSRECFTYTSVLISDVDLLLEPTDQPPKEKYSVQLEGKTYLPVFASGFMYGMLFPMSNSMFPSYMNGNRIKMEECLHGRRTPAQPFMPSKVK
ncbi:uncharacterized protein LOC131859977 isoform X2 [Cryptomeria japonica]|uniref:uncharacterized protein LOC131859798 isoform X2 n=1 Tax=Cryptomeria japonica TaxID=3369 RepID=UPI0027D9D95F|nr:uncharacterized protein LOC131859798 isoform X2 [Cryptomeria japonica]XP_059070280.1 uncharacterized protein LOC131859977 isoform X2 [Cryptomeria japonica]